MIQPQHDQKPQQQLTGPDEPGWRHHIWEIQPISDLMFLALLIAFLWALYALRQVILPVFAALFLAYLGDPLIARAASRWHIPRAVSSGATVIVAGLIVIGFFWWLGPILVEQTSALANKLPEYARSIVDAFHMKNIGLDESLQNWISSFQKDPDQFLQQLTQTSGKAFALVKNILGRGSYVLLCAITIPILFFLFAWRFDRLTATIVRFFPKSRTQTINRILQKMDKAVAGFFRGRLLTSVLVAAMLSIGWFLADVPYWFLLAVLTGILNIIPYASTISWPVAVLLKYFDGVSSGSTLEVVDTFVWPTLVFFIVQAVENWLLNPWVQSGQTDLSPVTVVVVVLVGGSIFGVWGMLFAIPAAACIKILTEELIVPRLLRWAETK